MKYLKKVNTDAELVSVKPIDSPIVVMSEASKTIQVVVKKPVPEGYVDLDLPSGLYWAKCNLGATKPEEYGLYFQWGATVGYPKVEAAAHSYWSGAPFNGGSSSYNSSYITQNSGTWLTAKAELKPEYDAVYRATNGAAHIPTRADCEELTANTKCNWITVNGVDGLRFKSKTDPNNYIFIPFSGRYNSGSGSGFGVSGTLWSSNLCMLNSTYAMYAWAFGFNESHRNVTEGNRNQGFCVRGVLG